MRMELPSGGALGSETGFMGLMVNQVIFHDADTSLLHYKNLRCNGGLKNKKKI